MRMLIAALKSLRPQQWTKNFFVFAGLIFSLNFFDSALLLKVIWAFIIFCLLSSAVYIINDLRDIEGDRQHPRKKLRPIASGQLGLPVALVLAVILFVAAIYWAYNLNFSFFLIALAYVGLMLAYTFLLKEIVLLDVFSIAAGFVLRAIAGVVVIAVELSPWLIICTILLALFIALGKRRHELLTLDAAASHRQILDEYNPQLLDQLISAVAGSTILAYALYTLWPETLSKFETKNLVYSVPFVLYGVCRYLYLIYKQDKGGRPEKVLLSDLSLMINILLWIGSLFIIIYWF
ncbi:decaprenyl-phosphate phosphoribosyltransferase [Candidatus Margulisiibacteriota bacterium]